MDWLSFARFAVPLSVLLLILLLRLALDPRRVLIQALRLQAGRARFHGDLGGLLLSVQPGGLFRSAGPMVLAELPGSRAILRRRKTGEAPVLTGDAEFDACWWLEGDALVWQALLTAELRALLLQVKTAGLRLEREQLVIQNLKGASTEEWVVLLKMFPRLVQAGRSELAEKLSEAVIADPAPGVRERALQLLLDSGLVSRSLLSRAARSEIPMVRVKAGVAMQEPELEPVLIGLLQDEKSRDAAIWGLKQVGGVGAVGPLLALPATIARQEAVEAIQKRLGPVQRGAISVVSKAGGLSLAEQAGGLSLLGEFEEPEEAATVVEALRQYPQAPFPPHHGGSRPDRQEKSLPASRSARKEE